MSPRFGPPPLLLLLLCCLMVRPTLGFPVRGGSATRRELAESASGDDLISGSDFLSVFIGASSINPRSSRARSLASRDKVAEDPEQSISSFGDRTIPRHKNTLLTSDSDPRVPDKSGIEIYEDLSISNTPAVGYVSFTSENMDKSPLPISSSHVLTVTDSDIEFQSESIVSSSRRNGQPVSEASEYFSGTSTEGSSSLDSKSVFTTDRTVAEIPSSLSDNKSEPQDTTPIDSTYDITVVTDIVTSREELLPPTESYSVEVTQDRSIIDHETLDTSGREENAESSSQLHNVELKTLEETSPNSSTVPVVIPTVHTPYSSTEGVISQDQLSTTYSQLSPSPTESTKVVEINQGDTHSSTQNQPFQQVVSVRVSSSVVQGPSPVPYLSRFKNSRIDQGKVIPKIYTDVLSQSARTPVSDEDMQGQIDKDTSGSSNQPTHIESSSIDAPQLQIVSTSLVTEEQPAATAVQRSQFSVEEAAPSSSEVSSHHHSPLNFNLQDKIIATVVETTRDPHKSPVSYHTSVSSATSGSRMRFYSDAPSYHRVPSSVAETVQTSVVTRHQGSSGPHYEQLSGGSLNNRNVPIETHMGRYGEPHHDVRISSPSLHQHTSYSTASHPHTFSQQMKSSREQKSYTRHQEPVERNYEVPEQSYGQPERSYGVPERNYEVDEAVSVMSHGRAHGLQPTTPAGSTRGAVDTDPRVIDTLHRQHNKDPNQKVGYVVEGSNYRKYQVEERTPDGFIVGEFGVVSHDDGSLRGVRYTADGTINPQVIYDALVKFLSL